MPLGGLTLSELIGALSHALDITEGQPEGHCVRCCWIGMHIGRAMGLSDEELWELYYTLLLKDLGCSSNAARICELYMTDDLSFKRDFKAVNGSLPKVLKFVIGHTGLGAGLTDRFKAMANIFQNGDSIAQELIQTRCTRGADIARQLRFSEAVAMGIHGLDEHWNGGGRPGQLKGEAIPVFSRIALLAQVVDVFNVSDGVDAACWEVEDRCGSWFDPAVVSAFRRCSEVPEFWERLSAPGLDKAVFALEPGRFVVPLDEDYLDEIAEAFGQVVDSKSPYRRRWLRRAALLHDMGKLGVSNAILDKPGKLDTEEWASVQRHAVYTESILSRIDAFSELAAVSGAHHERLDGKGYPRGIGAELISLETRIITTADIFDAITAERPYRGAVPVDKTLEIMGAEVGKAIDARCFEALQRIVGGFELS
jgi:HD-GYP domain-containing protein (c-di-GMP phosphodiesterase class II)